MKRRMLGLATALLVAMSGVLAANAGVAVAAAPATLAAMPTALPAHQPGAAPALQHAAGLAYGSFNVFQTWTMRGARPSMIKSGRFNGYCTVTASILVQEMERHGVVRLKIDFELRGPNAPGWTGWVLHTGQFSTKYFANDELSRYAIFALPAGYLRYPPNLVFSLWIKTVGERYGFPDYSRHYKLADVSCDASSPGSIDFGT